jgi:hypothetical protein
VGQSPACPRCEQSLPKDGWRTARDLIDAVFKSPEWGAGDGSAISIALRDLIRDGTFEQDYKTLKVRLAR